MTSLEGEDDDTPWVPSKEDETQAKHYKSQLSVGALDALKEFYGERDTRQKQFEDLKSQAENDFDGKKLLSMEAFTEDWNASQFWVSFVDSRKNITNNSAVQWWDCRYTCGTAIGWRHRWDLYCGCVRSELLHPAEELSSKCILRAP